MKKVIVIGSSGAGKTYFSQRLSEILSIKLVHIDRIYWKSGWVEPIKNEWRDTLGKILERDNWVIDGNYTATLEMRLEACDTAIFLDIRRTLCSWRVIRRTFRYWRRTRPEMADGCREWLDLKFLLFVWNYPKRTRPRIMSMLHSAKPSTRIIHLRSPRDVRRFIAGLERDERMVPSFPLAAAVE
jgi:adenylate kinase family enzyme